MLPKFLTNHCNHYGHNIIHFSKDHVWRWVRGECLNNKYYERFDEFKETINQSLQKVSKGENKKEMDSLLTLKFQLFDNAYYSRG